MSLFARAIGGLLLLPFIIMGVIGGIVMFGLVAGFQLACECCKRIGSIDE